MALGRPQQPALFSESALDPSGDSASAPLVARVLLEDNALELDYSIPDSLAQRVQLGSRVHVPLQRRRATGTVVQLLPDSTFHGKLKPVADAIGTRPVFPENLLRLAQWASGYYLCPLRVVLRAMLPESVRRKPESFLSDSHLTLARMPDSKELEKLHKTAPIQARIIEMLHAHQGPAALSELRRELPRATQVIQILVKKGIVHRAEVRMERDPFQDEAFVASTPHALTEEQNAALNQVLAAIDQPAQGRPMLLHGVTGSGKTEIYLQAITKVLELGKTALVLVPEISLTPQTIERFKARFADRAKSHQASSAADGTIAVLHSHLSDGERHDEWYKIHEGRAGIVIGARSAIFAPLENVGIIIVDEEHEPSYKQEETPRYQARDLAVVRAKLEHCACLLGSATPCLESF
ncbi:MAG TPA: DEAD/DEAH box helicase, partial [Verrucomicrobiaceae bacterium]